MQAALLAVHSDSATGALQLIAAAFNDRVQLYRCDTQSLVTLQAPDANTAAVKLAEHDTEENGPEIEDADDVGNEKESKAASAAGTPATVRVLLISPDSRVLAVARDDRKLTIYDTLSGAAIATFPVHRKASTAHFVPLTESGRYCLMLADKTGDILSIEFSHSSTSEQQSAAPSMRVSLGHLATIIQIAHTARRAADGSQSHFRLLTADSDGKIRISRFPRTHVIEGFCLVSTTFISAFAVIDDAAVHQPCVVSGEIGSVVKLFDGSTGEKLSEFQLPSCMLVDFISSICLEPISGLTVIAAQPLSELFTVEISNNAIHQRGSIKLSAPVSAMECDGCGRLIVLDESPKLSAFRFSAETKTFEAIEEFTPAFTALAGSLFVDTAKPELSIVGTLHTRRCAIIERQELIARKKAEREAKRKKPSASSSAEAGVDNDGDSDAEADGGADQ